jgi:hypothetical protein
LTGKKDEDIYRKLGECKRQSEELIKNKRLTMLQDEKERSILLPTTYKDWR